ncbi:MAG: thioredoxin domain-containing protein [Deltaproteobacteria bacterium]|nr:MAG: thioredoxin domain-containing protein [Deltaproteobacteria bacterium]
MPNRLATESSAYLLQHQNNPVDWYPWGEEAFERARRDNRPVLVSIGYSSCHWCHVMEHESFEDPEVARLMNENFVCIKVDREERPDVDQIYMETVMRLTGAGGWPLNVFCTPEGRPFYGGTYFPPERRYQRPSWPDVLRSVARTFNDQPEQVEAQATQILDALRVQPDSGGSAELPGRATLPQLCVQLMQRADTAYGGFGQAPKFPTPTNLEAILLAGSHSLPDAGALEHVVFSLKRMARGGIYDQLGGGFHRYSTDAHWLVPHFEKMLYDQGQLLRVYAEAFRQTRDPELAWPVEETIAFLERELRSPEGGFYASQDADSEGEEGRYYVWSPDEVEAVLGSERGREFVQAYGVSAGGNFEHTGKSVLAHVLAGERARFRDERQLLLEARAQRIAPDTDCKIITSWVGYTISGLATAGAAFERADWVAAAARAADFVLERLTDPVRGLMRVWDGSRAKIPGFLDDHAALLCALLDLQRAGGGDRYLEAALRTADAMRERFFSSDTGDLFFTAGEDSSLILRPLSDSDGATPAAAGLAALGLVRLSELCGRSDLREIAQSVIEKQAALANRVPVQVPTLVRAAALLDLGMGVALVLGAPEDPRSQALAARARALLGAEDAVVVMSPDAAPPWLAPAWLEGRDALAGTPTAYLCRGQVCSLPAQKPEELALPVAS